MNVLAIEGFNAVSVYQNHGGIISHKAVRIVYLNGSNQPQL